MAKDLNATSGAYWCWLWRWLLTVVCDHGFMAVLIQFWDTVPQRCGLGGGRVWLAVWLGLLVCTAAQRAAGGRRFPLTRRELAQDWRDIKDMLEEPTPPVHLDKPPVPATPEQQKILHRIAAQRERIQPADSLCIKLQQRCGGRCAAGIGDDSLITALCGVAKAASSSSVVALARAAMARPQPLLRWASVAPL